MGKGVSSACCVVPRQFAHQKGTRGGAGGPVPEQEVEEGGDEEEEEGETEEAPVEAVSEA